jgi:predicted amidophosphoribosyltransferase
MRGPAGSVSLRTGSTAPPEVVLVDDVVTTGATLAACIAALRDAGSRRITPIAFARTTGR